MYIKKCSFLNFPEMLHYITEELKRHYIETSSKLIPIPSMPETSTAIQDVYTNLEIDVDQ